jgi:hypothetical protein
VATEGLGWNDFSSETIMNNTTRHGSALTLDAIKWSGMLRMVTPRLTHTF